MAKEAWPPAGRDEDDPPTPRALAGAPRQASTTKEPRAPARGE
jgi:hypothetical protein